MKFILDQNEIEATTIDWVELREATDEDINLFEQRTNGSMLSPEEVFDIDFCKRLEEIINKYRGIIGERLPEPSIDEIKLGVPIWSHEPNNYKFNGETYGFSLGEFDDLGDAWVKWSFGIKYNSENGLTGKSTGLRSLEIHLIPVIEELSKLQQPSKAEKTLDILVRVVTLGEACWGFIPPKEIQADCSSILKDYFSRKKQIDKRNTAKENFFKINKGKFCLYIKLTTQDTILKYLDGCCGFDIFAKERELKTILEEHRKHQEKVENSNNIGEKDVDYAIKWFLATYGGYAVSIKGDCESRHRINCIQLCKPDFIDEPQEIDHILVCPAGVVIIETKHWKGYVDIRPDGKWTRKSDADSSVVGVDSPKFQMRRHEVLMKKILPTVAVHSLLCFSNASAIIDGGENFKDYPIITVDQLEVTLTDLCAKGTYSQEDIDRMAAAIDAHKVYKV